MSGDVGDVLTRTANAGFSTALSIDENNNIVFTQPNNTNKVYIYPKCLAFADRDCIAKMSVKLKNTGETTGSTFRPYIAIVDCKTGKITYKGIGTAGQASTDGTVITHSRVVDKNSVVMFFFYCNTPTANAETTFTEFEAELLTPGFEDEIKYKEYLGSSRNGDGYLLSIEGTNNIMANVDSFVAKVKANFID